MGCSTATCLRQQVRDIEHLKDVLVTSWEQISQACNDRAIGQFQKRLASITAAKGGHIEHFLISCMTTVERYINVPHVCDVTI